MNLFEKDVLNHPIESFYCEDTYIEYPVKPHWHYFVELIYVIHGCVNITSNEKTYMLKKGDLLLIPPHSIHGIYQLTDESGEKLPIKYACVKFNTSKIQPVEDYIPDLNILFNNISNSNDLLFFKKGTFKESYLDAVFAEIIDEINNREYGFNTYIFSLLSGLVLRMLRYWYKEGINLYSEHLNDNYANSLSNILLYIDTNSGKKINISEMAKMCNMSYSHFARMFHRQYGQSCSEYIEFVRLSKAENLLLFTDYDLNYIAEETGFSDCSHLIKCFKKKYKITPKQYRKKNLK